MWEQWRGSVAATYVAWMNAEIARAMPAHHHVPLMQQAPDQSGVVPATAWAGKDTTKHEVLMYMVLYTKHSERCLDVVAADGAQSEDAKAGRAAPLGSSSSAQ